MKNGKYLQLPGCLAVVVLMSVCSSLAVTNRTWDFSDPGHYSLSDSNEITVADDVASLSLIDVSFFDESVADCLAGADDDGTLHYGADAALGLGKDFGYFLPSGSFVSRVMDGGLGNQWKLLRIIADGDIVAANGTAEISTNEADLVALYHLNDDLLDAVTGSSATYSGTENFVEDAVFGSRAVRNNEGYAILAGSGLVDNASEMTFCFWWKMGAYPIYESMSIASFLTGPDFSESRLTYTVKTTFSQYVSHTCKTTTAIELERWYFIVGTWNEARGNGYLYINGEHEGTTTSPYPAYEYLHHPFAFSDSIKLSHPSSIRYDSMHDEVALYRRELSAEEIKAMYLRSEPVQVQIRSGSSSTNLAAHFTGPDGTNSAFVVGSHPLVPLTGFEPTDQYVQYRVDLGNSHDRDNTPLLNAVGFLGNTVDEIDDTMGDFQQGIFSGGATSLPFRVVGSFLGLSKRANGGYEKSGVYMSRLLDTGTGLRSWIGMEWDLGNRPIDHNVTHGLVALWPLDGGWDDSSGSGIGATASSGVLPYDLPKVGSGAQAFGSSNATVAATDLGVVKGLEFWVKPARASGGLLEASDGSTTGWLMFTNGSIHAEGWGTPVDIYVNGRGGAPHLQGGWNHVGMSVSDGFGMSNLTVGVANGLTFEGVMDDWAIYNRELTEGEAALHYADGIPYAGGSISLAWRVGDSEGEVYGKSFSTGPVFGQGRYGQFRVTMQGDGDATPALQAVRMYYNQEYVEEDTAAEFGDGDFGTGREIAWYGEEIGRHRLARVGPFYTRTGGDITWRGLWEMEEETWPAGQTVIDSVGNRDGTPQGDAAPVVRGRVGMRCGSFDGDGDYISLQSIGDLLNQDFTVGLWFKTASTNRSALISNYDGDYEYTLEMNGDGTGATKAGSVTFVVDDKTGGKRWAASLRGGLNDGKWHHVAGIRRAPYIHIYVDGIRTGSAEIGDAYSLLGFGTPYVARYPVHELYYEGLIDEVGILLRPMSEAEIGEWAGVGRQGRGEAEYVSEPINAERVSIWRSLSWMADGPHGSPHEPDGLSLVGLWHLNNASGDALDSSGQGNNGGATDIIYGNSGVFSNSFGFDGAGSRVSSAGSMGLSTSVTVSAWINPSAIQDRMIIDRLNGANGFALRLNAQGHAVFQVGTTECVDWIPVLDNAWNHIGGTYDGGTARLHVNGVLRDTVDVIGVSMASGTPFVFGQTQVGGAQFEGLIDEVAVHNRALGIEEMTDRYRSGSGTLKFQVRAGDVVPLTDPFIGPDGTSGSYFTELTGSLTEHLLDVRQHFQVRAVLDSESALYPAVLRGIRADVTSFSAANPWVQPSDLQAHDFVGRLTQFEHQLGQVGPDTDVRYQISGDNGASWHYWGGSAWEAATGLDWPGEVSEAGTISTNIGSFFDQLYSKDGGTFKFRAFLHSEGDYQIELDEVNIEASTGRIVVTVPNGEEVGDDAWVVGVTNVITWDAEGDVGSSLTIEFSEDGGQSWSVVDDNVPHAGTNGAYAWPTPYFGLGAGRDECRIKITDNTDATVWDMSDANFELVFRYRLMAPNGGEVWYIGETNLVRWHEPPGLGTPADLYFNLDGHGQLGTGLSDPGWRYRESVPTTPGSTNNTHVWVTPKDIPELISPAARLQITPENSMSAHDMSDLSYTMAGIRITNPNDSTAWKRGSAQTVTWAAAGDVAGGVTLELSEDGGANWNSVVPGTIPCSVSSNNTYSWTIVADNPSQNSMLRMVSTNQSRIWAVSDVFTVSDIDIKSPVAGDEWQTLSTNLIKWTAGGAGDEVNLFYSIDGGTNWTLINEEDPVFNDNTTGVTNEYLWVVPDLPGDTQIRIQSLLSAQLFADSDMFKISGIRITAPNSDARWEYGSQNTIDWVYAGGDLEQGRVRFSYDNGHSFTNLKDVGLFSGNYGFTPDKPTVRALASVKALDEPYFSLGVMAQSDSYFTNAGIKVTSPELAAVIKMGTLAANPIEWLSAGVIPNNGVVDLSYSDGTTETALFTLQNNEDFEPSTHISGYNFKPWTPETSLNPSETARVKVFGHGPFGDYTGWSEVFALQGVRIIEPTSGSAWNIDTTREIRWLNAGFGPGADARMYISTDGGSTFDPTPILPDVILNNGDLDWLIPFGTPPTTNALLRLDVVDDPESFSAYSLTFTLKGLSVSQPTVGTSWDLGDAETIEVQAAGAGNLVNIYYSSDDGASFDTVNPISVGAGISDGANSLDWTIDTYRVPSTNARIWVDSLSTDATIVSDPFTVAGILVTEPASVNIWAADETNHIEWIAVGTSANFKIDLVDVNTNFIMNVITNVAGTSYEWDTPIGAVGTDLRIRVSEVVGSYVAVSELFKIVSDPTLEVLQPVDGAFLKNGRTYQVVWTKAGTMPEEFEVSYSLDGFTMSSNVIASGTFVPTNNQYFLDWELDDPAELGSAKIRVMNTSPGFTTIGDTTEDINMVADMVLNSPNGGGQYYALKTYDVTWFTSGNTTEFDLYYSTNQFRTVDSWTPITTAGSVSGLGHGQLSQWSDWQVADDVNEMVWLRIQDANYTEIYPANVEGPFDDSDAMFSIIYYTIEWNVINEETLVPLDKLAVSDSSGWSESGLSSPIIHYYPYGNYDTIWSRALFASKVEFDWSAEPSRTITVELLETGQEPDFDVMANFAYDSANRSFNIASWIERGGQVLGNPDASLIEVYESDGDKIKQISKDSSVNGVFFSLWDVNQTEDEEYGTNFNYSTSEVFWAKVLVQFSGEWYSSALTFQLRQPASDEVLQVIDAIEASATNILGEVSGIGALVGGVSGQVTGVSNQIDDLSAQVGDGFADVLAAVGTNWNILLDEVLPGIGDISNNLVNVFGPSITNIEDVVQLISGEGGGARILTRPLELIRGSTNTFLYRTQDFPSYPTLDVLHPTSGASLLGSPQAMTPYGSVAGIYQAQVTASFAVDSCVIVCTDPPPDGASDRLLVDIVDVSLDLSAEMMGMSTQMTAMASTIAGLETNITSLASLSGEMAGLTGVLNGMTNTLVSLETAVLGLPDMSSLTNSLASLESAVLGLPDMSDLTNVIGELGTKLDNLPDLGVVTQAIDGLSARIDALPDMSVLTNSLATLEAAVLGLPDLSGMSNNIAALEAAVAGIPTNIDLTAVQDGVDGLRTDLAGVLGVDLSGAQAALDSILAAVGSAAGTDLSGLEGEFQSLKGALQGVSDVNLTGLDQKLSSLQDALAGVDRIEQTLGSQSDGNNEDSLFAKLAQLESSADQAGDAASGAETFAASAKTKAGDAASGISALKQALAAGDAEEAKRQLGVIRQALASAQADIAQIPDGVTLDQLKSEMGATKKTIAELAKSNGFTWLTSMGEDALAPSETPPDGEPTDLGKLSQNIDEVRGSMEFMQKLLDEMRYEPVVEEQWIGVEE